MRRFLLKKRFWIRDARCWKKGRSDRFQALSSIQYPVSSIG
jgi:hypothetical protein